MVHQKKARPDNQRICRCPSPAADVASLLTRGAAAGIAAHQLDPLATCRHIDGRGLCTACVLGVTSRACDCSRTSVTYARARMF